jgi:hypothetical protein
MALDGTTPLRCHGWGSRALRDTMMDRAPLGQNWRAQASPASAADAATKVSQIGSGQGWIERREREGCAAADGGVGVWLPGVRWCSRSGDSSVFPASCFSTATPLTPTESVPRLAPPPQRPAPPSPNHASIAFTGRRRPRLLSVPRIHEPRPLMRPATSSKVSLLFHASSGSCGLISFHLLSLSSAFSPL